MGHSCFFFFLIVNWMFERFYWLLMLLVSLQFCWLSGTEMKAVTHALCWITLRSDSQHICMSSSLQIQWAYCNKWKLEWTAPTGIWYINLPWRCQWMYSWICWSEGNDHQARLASKAAITNVFLLRRSEVLRSLRHCLWSQSQGHHTIDRLEERGIERGNTQWSSLQGGERVVNNRTNMGAVSKATVRKLLRDGVGHMWAFPSTWVPSLTDLNWAS